MKNILLISHYLGLSGAPYSLLRHASYFRDAGHHVDVWTIDFFEDNRLEPEYIKAGFYPIHIANNAASIDACYRKQQKKYDLIVCNTTCTYLAYNTLSKFGVPIIWFIRETVGIPSEYAWNWNFATVLKHCYNIYVPSDHSADVLRRFNKNVRVVNNAVADTFRKFVSPREELRIGYIGSLEQRKGVFILIQAFKSLLEEYPDSTLLIAADYENELGRPLKGMASGVNQIIWLGAVQNERKEEFFDAIDVLCVPSFDEPSGLTLAEGAMKGKILITTETTGAKYLVDSNNGYIVTPGSVEELFSALKGIGRLDARVKESFQYHSRENYLKFSTPAREKENVLQMLAENDGNQPPYTMHRKLKKRTLWYRIANRLRAYYVLWAIKRKII